MMKKIRLTLMTVVVAAGTHISLMANETIPAMDWIDVVNRLVLEYDDNVNETSTDKQDSLKISDEIDFGLTFDLQPTFLTLRYRPAFVWWENREPDDTDFNQSFDAVLNHRFSPRLSAGLKHVYRLTEQPEEIDGGFVVRENNDYEYNVSDANVDFEAFNRTHLIGLFRYTDLNYDDEEVSQTADFDSTSAGLTLRHQLTEFASILADYRQEDISYDYTDRGAVSDFIGLGYEQSIGASFIGVIRGGNQDRDFDAAGVENESQPYADGTLTYLYSPRTRISVGGGFALIEADVYPFAAQDRTTIFTTVAHDLTARISLFAALSHQLSDYNAETRIEDREDVPEDGEETVLNGSVTAAYRINNQNSVDISWQYLDLSSDLRDDFDRNRLSLGWRLDI